MLSLPQKRVLELLSMNARLTNKEIAQSVGISEDSVADIIHSLCTQGYSRFFALFDAHFLGYEQYHFLFQLKSDVFDWHIFEKIPNVMSINDCFGKYDVQLVVLLKSESEVTSVVTQIKALCAVGSVTVLKVFANIKHLNSVIPPLQNNTKIVFGKKNAFSKYVTGNAIGFNSPFVKHAVVKMLDATDKKIIGYLLKRPRASIQELADAISANRETVRYRLHGYFSEGFLQNVGLMHDFTKFGLYTGHLLLRIGKVSQEFISFVATNPHVFYAPQLFGEYNCMIYLLADSPAKLGEEMLKIRFFLKDSLEAFDLLLVNTVHKALGFPETELR